MKLRKSLRIILAGSAACSVILTSCSIFKDDPEITVSPVWLDFGTVTTGLTETVVLTISNTSVSDTSVNGNDTRDKAALVVSGMFLSGSPEFSYSGPTSFKVPDGSSKSISINYSPHDVGKDNGQLEIHSNDPDESVVKISIGGTGKAPQPGMTGTPFSTNIGIKPPDFSEPRIISVPETSVSDTSVNDTKAGIGGSLVVSGIFKPGSPDIS